MALTFDDRDMKEARRANRILSMSPRFRIRGDWNVGIFQSLLRLIQKPVRPWPRRFGLRVEDRRVTALGREVGVRIIHPRGAPRGVYLDIHGGGWVIGNARMDDRVNTLIAAHCGFVVVSVDYRLFPHVPITACIDDCEAAAIWTLNALPTFGTSALFIGGESAGGHLAAATLLRLRDSLGALPPQIRGAVLFYGLYDFAGSDSLRAAGPDTLVLHGPSSRPGLLRLTPGLSDEDRRSPALSPLYADLSGMPPALILAGTLDPLLDDSRLLHEAWNATNPGAAELVIAPEAPHAFNRFPTSMASKTNAYVRAWMMDRLAAG